MKKRILVFVLSVVMTLACVAGLTACNGDSVDGTYYVYMNGEKQEGMVMTLDDGKVTLDQAMGEQSISLSGTYKSDGSKVSITVTVMGVSQTQELTIVSDGILKGDNDAYYCKDGKTPPSDDE